MRAPLLAISLILSLTGCSAPQHGPPVELDPAPASDGRTGLKLPTHWCSSTTETCVTVTAMESAVEALIASREFGTALSSVRALAVSPNALEVSGSSVLADLRGTGEHEPLPIDYEYPDRRCHGNIMGTTGVSTGPQGEIASMCLNAAVFERWGDSSPFVIAPATAPIVDAQASRGCALNTLVHEWTHTVRDANGEAFYTDSGFKGARHPLASYTVGAVAECVVVGRSAPPTILQACISAVGTTSFDPGSCHAEWWGTFDASLGDGGAGGR